MVCLLPLASFLKEASINAMQDLSCIWGAWFRMSQICIVSTGWISALYKWNFCLSIEQVATKMSTQSEEAELRLCDLVCHSPTEISSNLLKTAWPELNCVSIFYILSSNHIGIWPLLRSFSSSLPSCRRLGELLSLPEKIFSQYPGRLLTQNL